MKSVQNKFNFVNDKYEELKDILELLFKKSTHKNREESDKLISQAANLWNDIKQDSVFVGLIYEKNKDYRFRQILKLLDEHYLLTKEIVKDTVL